MGNNLMQTDLSVWGMYQHADIVVKCVMIGLILASVVTWARLERLCRLELLRSSYTF